MKTIQIFMSALVMMLTGGNGAKAAELSCASSTTLDELVTCIRNQMPASGSEGFVIPGATEQADWRSVVRQMLDGSCNIALPASLTGIMQIRSFTDSQNGRSYCVFIEVLDANNDGKVDRGWGTFIVDPNAARELCHQAPHPIADSTTENQAVGVFKGTQSRSFLMAGSHRNANAATSPCQSAYLVADAAHNVANMFQPTTQELAAHYGAFSWNAIQWHGMAADTCLNVEAYLSHGRNQMPAAGDKIVELKNNMLGYHPTWKLETPGTGACSLNATDNVQGRLLNDVAAGAVCGTAAPSYAETFLHIEQDPGFRNPNDWIAAVNDTWPTTPPPTPPAAPGSLMASAVSKSQINLAWTDHSDNESGFQIEPSTDGNVFTQIATVGANVTSIANTGLKANKTYWYRVRAYNAVGASAYSNVVSATTPRR